MHPTGAVGALSPTPRACVERIGNSKALLRRQRGRVPPSAPTSRWRASSRALPRGAPSGGRLAPGHGRTRSRA